MPKKIVIPYQPRGWQYHEHNNLDRFTVLVIHRRAGKTVFAVNELIKRVLSSNKKRPQVAYIAPTYSQAKKVSWDIFKEFVKPIPGVKINESELRIDFPNGGRILVLGAENYDGLRGLYLDYAVMDEVADMPEPLWNQVIRPALSDRKGGALFIGTPKGKNYFHDLYLKGKTGDKSWRSTLLKYTDTDSIDSEEMELLKVEYKDKMELFEQEYNCSFTSAIKGAYFGRHIERAENDGRITTQPWDEDDSVVAAWDIGLDGTAIWYAQIQGGQVNIIDFDFFDDKDVREILRTVVNKPYLYSVQLLPHDAVKRQITNKNDSVKGIIQKQGLRVKIVKRIDVLDRITIARDLLNKCVFNNKTCEKGLHSLRLYKSGYDEAKGILKDKPEHSIHSHPADAFCYLAVGLKSGKNYSNNYSPKHNNMQGKPSVKKDWKVF